MRGGLDATGSCDVMTCVKLDSDEVPAYSARRDKRGAGSAKWVQNKAMRLAEAGDQRFERLSRLLRRMKPVARIGPVDHIRDRAPRGRRIALRQKIGLLVLVAHEADG